MKVDMSPAAVTARLRLASQLRRLCLSLAKAKPVERAQCRDVVSNRMRAAQPPDKEDTSREHPRTD